MYTEKGHEKTIGHHIMDRKRLRIFQTITKPSHKNAESATKRKSEKSLSIAKSGSGLKLTVQSCEQA